MAKRKRSSSQIQRLLSALVAAVILGLALLLSNLTGIDLTQLLGTPGATRTPTPVTPLPPGTQVARGNVVPITIAQGFGAQKGFWQVFFTAPTGSSDASTYVGGIDTQLVAAISAAQRTLDIAAFEFNNAVLTQAVLAAKTRGVTVRVVTDDEHGLEDDDSRVQEFISAGIPVRDDSRGGFMHDKFMIIDGTTVWTGSWNYTVNDTYRNNNNALSLRSQSIVQDYQAEFNEMFDGRQFGRTSPANTPNVSFTQDGTPIQVYFGSEDPVTAALVLVLREANTSIRFMAFSFTLDELRGVIQERAADGVTVQGIFETTGSETEFSELTPLFCDGLDVRQDGNRFILHHKVFIIDENTVVTGSFNFSASAAEENDENLLIIRDPDLAGEFITEFNRRWAEATTPSGLAC